MGVCYLVRVMSLSSKVAGMEWWMFETKNFSMGSTMSD